MRTLRRILGRSVYDGLEGRLPDGSSGSTCFDGPCDVLHGKELSTFRDGILPRIFGCRCVLLLRLSATDWLSHNFGPFHKKCGAEYRFFRIRPRMLPMCAGQKVVLSLIFTPTAFQLDVWIVRVPPTVVPSRFDPKTSAEVSVGVPNADGLQVVLKTLHR